jgi:hypothetical protein
LKACLFHERTSLIASLNALRSSGVSFRVIVQYLLGCGNAYLPISFPQVGKTGPYHRFELKTKASRYNFGMTAIQ